VERKKKSYPKGIYANRYENTPNFVRTNIKIDNRKAIEWLQTQPQPYTHLQVLESNAPDEYGNTVYMCIDEYKMYGDKKKAKEGMAQAKQALNQPLKAVEEDDLPLPSFGTNNEDTDDIPF
jgi:hypothetical protein